MKRILIALVAAMLLSAPAFAADKGAMPFDEKMAQAFINMSIVRIKLEEDVSVDDAVQSMQLRANGLNFKMVADLPLSEQVKAMGEDARYMRILAFCDALIAKKMVEFNPIFAGFLPCRIAVIEDAKGQGWIVTMNMDMMLHAVDLPPDLQPLAKKVRDVINEIVEAGRIGDL